MTHQAFALFKINKTVLKLVVEVCLYISLSFALSLEYPVHLSRRQNEFVLLYAKCVTK